MKDQEDKVIGRIKSTSVLNQEDFDRVHGVILGQSVGLTKCTIDVDMAVKVWRHGVISEELRWLEMHTLITSIANLRGG
jgi:hypothetical protein